MKGKDDSRRLAFVVCAIIAGLCFIIGILITLLLLKNPSPPQIQSSSPNPSQFALTAKPVVIVDAKRLWTPTNIQLKKGDTVDINATGQISVASGNDTANRWVGPDGWGYIPQFHTVAGPPTYIYSVNDSLGCLIGKVGNGKPFKVGGHFSLTAKSSGTLYLGINDAISDWRGNMLDEESANRIMFADNQGGFTVTVEVK